MTSENKAAFHQCHPQPQTTTHAFGDFGPCVSFQAWLNKLPQFTFVP